MAITITPYNHTAHRIHGGLDLPADTFKINLYTVLPSIPTATTKALAEVGATQVATANGYTQDTKTLLSVATSTFSTNGSKFDAEDVQWTAATGNIAAGFAMIYNDTDTNDPPLYRIDFGGTVAAIPGDTFDIIWHPNGIYTFVPA